MLNKILSPLQPHVNSRSGAGGQAEKDTGGNGAVWRREMEKQEMALWLNHGPLPSAQHEQTLFRQAPQSVVKAEGPSAGVNNADDSGKPREDEAQASNRGAQEPSPAGAPNTTVQASRPSVHMAGNAAPADFSTALADHKAETINGGELLPAASAQRFSPDGFVESVMSQLNQEIGARTSSSLAPAYVAATQPGQARQPEVSTTGAMVRRVAGFDLDRSGATAGQKAAKSALPDEQEELATQRTAPSSLPRDGEAPPVRIHTFWSDQSVRIWVGTDGSAALDAQQLALAAHDLRRLLREQGATLESLTVNGETVLEQDAGQAPARNSALAPERPIPRTTQA